VRLLIDENLPPRRASTPARGRLRETAHAAEVDLHLPAGVAVGHPHRRLLAAVPQLLDAEAVQRPLRNHHAAAGQQIDELDRRHVRLQPRLDAVALGVAAFPRGAAAAGPGRADRLATASNSSSVSCSWPPSRTTPAASAASTCRRIVSRWRRCSAS